MLEHMLSMGNKKYPAESEFKEFVTTNGGEETAFTNDEYTGYLFSIEGQHLREALDRFAQMFISPLLRKGMLLPCLVSFYCNGRSFAVIDRFIGYAG